VAVRKARRRARPGLDLHWLAERRAAGRGEPLQPFVEIVTGHTDVDEPLVGGAQSVLPAAGRQVLEKLDPRPLTAEREMRHPHVRARLPDDRLQVAAGLFLLEKHLHAHRVPPEMQRPVQVRDRQAGVVENWHS
jgi:hypothetical protein